jgi:hypothetical protein
MAMRLSASRAGRPLSSGRFLILISVRGWVDPRVIIRLEGLRQLKNPTVSSGIESATFWLVALFNYATACPTGIEMVLQKQLFRIPVVLKTFKSAKIPQTDFFHHHKTFSYYVHKNDNKIVNMSGHGLSLFSPFLLHWSNGQGINWVFKSPASAPIVATILKTKQTLVYQIYLNGQQNTAITALNVTAQYILKPASY